jgi:hypothetical protein
LHYPSACLISILITYLVNRMMLFGLLAWAARG